MDMTVLPKIGDELVARITESTVANEWKADCPTLPREWSAELRSRSGELYEPGDECLFWVYGIVVERQLILLSDSQFGRFPIADRMRPRYIQAIRSTLHVISCPQEAESVSPEDLSEVKGIFNRCIRKDQWDWLTVYKTLDRPSFSILQKSVSYLGALARAVRHQEAEEIMRYAGLLSGLELGTMLEVALARITANTPHLSYGTSFEPISAVRHDQSLPEGEVDSDPYIISQVARAKLERANTNHARALQTLVAFLESNGFVVERSRLVDAYCRLKTGPAIFEVKSITPENERSQCRQSLSQLYEYRYLHSMPEASLWVVLSERPRISWIADYLQGDRGVGVLWIESEELKGPGLTSLLASWPTVTKG